MMPNVRLYARYQGSTTRWYADFRRFADVGGRQEALIPPGDTAATTDYSEAVQLALDRVRYLRGLHGGTRVLAASPQVSVGAFVRSHLRAEARSHRLRPTWLAVSTLYLQPFSDGPWRRRSCRSGSTPSRR